VLLSTLIAGRPSKLAMQVESRRLLHPIYRQDGGPLSIVEEPPLGVMSFMCHYASGAYTPAGLSCPLLSCRLSVKR
jgi:hypothetical protein